MPDQTTLNFTPPDEDVSKSDLPFTQIEIDDLDVLTEKTDAVIDRSKSPYQQGAYKYATPINNVKPIGDILGGFDLDPCASKNSVLAETNIRNDGGLTYNWDKHSTVWVNPPYDRGEVIKWVRKAINTNAETVVMLLRGDGSTNWFHLAAENADLVAYLSDRINFGNHNDNGGFASVYFVFGKYPDKLQKHFENNGWVPKPTPKQDTITVNTNPQQNMLPQMGTNDTIQIHLSEIPKREAIETTTLDLTPISRKVKTHKKDGKPTSPLDTHVPNAHNGDYLELTCIPSGSEYAESYTVIYQARNDPQTIYCLISDEENIGFVHHEITEIRAISEYDKTTQYVATPR